MRKFIFIFVLAVVGWNVCQCQAQVLLSAPEETKIVRKVGNAFVEYIESRDVTRVRPSLPIYIEGNNLSSVSLNLSVDFEVKGTKVLIPKNVHIVFISQQQKQRLANNNDRILSLFDDVHKLESSEMSVIDSSKTKQGNYWEVVEADINFSSFKKFLESKKPEMWLGKSKLNLTIEHIEMLRDMIRAVER